MVEGEPLKLEQTNELYHEDSESLLNEYCSICYTNNIIIGVEPLSDQEKEGTFEFSCKHRFCTSCASEFLRDIIESNNI